MSLSESEVSVGVAHRVEAQFRRQLRWAMFWPVLSLLVGASLLVALVLVLQHANERVDHSRQIIGRATQLERLVVDRESRLRGYLLTGAPSSLSAYIEADGSVRPAIDRLQRLSSDDPRQVARVESMRSVLARWAEYAEKQVALRGGPAGAEDIAFHLIDGEAIQGDIQSRLREFVAAEEGTRDARVARADIVTRLALLLGALLALVAGPVLALTTARRMRRSRQSYHEALEAQERAARSLRESEIAVRAERDFSTAVLDTTASLIVVVDTRGNIVRFSRACERLTGYAERDVLGKDVSRLFVPDADLPRVEATFRRLRMGDFPNLHRNRWRMKDGSERLIDWSNTAIADEQGQVKFIIGTGLDITERTQAEEALREAGRHKDEFLGVLSHELRNPLAPIRNSVQVLSHVDPASAQGERARTIIARQVDHLARLVDDLLDVKRISSGKLRLRKTVMDLAEQARETIEDFRPSFATQSLSLELPERPVWVDGDRTRLAQLLGNLLQNAVKFTNAGGRVAVTLQAEPGHARLRVRDDGVGVPSEVLETLFEPFVQNDKTLHRTMGGLGLGLSLVRGIAQLHGGSVVARSEGVGKGAEFVVTLPTTEPAVAGERGPTVEHAGVKCRVLVIEDNVDAAESLRDILQVLGGHEVELAYDGLAGVEAAREHHPDVVLCDIGLPTMDGYEVARRLRASGVAPQARLVAVSGYASPEDVDRAISAGFDYHLAKPPDIDQVLRLIAETPASDSSDVLLPLSGREEAVERTLGPAGARAVGLPLVRRDVDPVERQREHVVGDPAVEGDALLREDGVAEDGLVQREGLQGADALEPHGSERAAHELRDGGAR